MRLAKAAKVSAAETVGAFTLVASAKAELMKTPKALSKVTEQVLLLANAQGLTLANSAKVLTESLNQFGASADRAGEFVDILAASSKFGASAVGESGVAIVDSGVAASEAKLSFAELNSVIQVLSQVGIRGANSGTALKELFKTLEAQSNKRLKPSIQGLNKALDNLAKKNLNTRRAMKLFGSSAFEAGLKLVEKRKEVAKMTENVQTSGIAMVQAAARTNTFSAKLRGLGVSVDESLIKVFNKLEKDKVFSNMADEFTKWADTITIEDINNVAKGIVAMAKGAASLAINLGDAASRFGEIVGFWRDLFGGGGGEIKAPDITPGLDMAVKRMLGMEGGADILLKISAPAGMVEDVKTEARSPNMKIGWNMVESPA